MKFNRERFMNSAEECAWLRSEHNITQEFESFTLYGSKKNPVRLDLYTVKAPAYNIRPEHVLHLGS